MASIESAIYTRLSGHAGLAALVSTRIYPVVRKQGAALPCITFQLVGQEDMEAMGDNPGLVHARFQFDIVDDDPDGALAVRAQLRAALVRWRNVAGSPSVQDTFPVGSVQIPDPDHEPPLVRLVEDFMFHYVEG